MSTYPMPPLWVLDKLREGLVIPAHPLALTPARKLDLRRQRALTRYYHAAGVGGTYWAGGLWWGNYTLSSEPTEELDNNQQEMKKDKPVITTLAKHPGKDK